MLETIKNKLDDEYVFARPYYTSLDGEESFESEVNWLIEQVEKLPKELKYKKDIPTVIEYQGRRYVLKYD
jgi:hypothetical protein